MHGDEPDTPLDFESISNQPTIFPVDGPHWAEYRP